MTNCTAMDKFAALRTFVAVVNTGSFARASEKLGMSRAMTTKHVQTLEAELGDHRNPVARPGTKMSSARGC